MDPPNAIVLYLRARCSPARLKLSFSRAIRAGHQFVRNGRARFRLGRRVVPSSAFREIRQGASARPDSLRARRVDGRLPLVSVAIVKQDDVARLGRKDRVHYVVGVVLRLGRVVASVDVWRRRAPIRGTPRGEELAYRTEARARRSVGGTASTSAITSFVCVSS
jgi:hypothetical protein